MRKAPFLTAAMFSIAILTFPVHAQDAKKEAAIKPADGPSQVVLESWNDIGRKLIAMAEDFPEDKYDFKPTPAQRSFAEQLLHAANVNYFFTNPAMGQKMPKEENPKRANFKSKAEIVCLREQSLCRWRCRHQSQGRQGNVRFGGRPQRPTSRSASPTWLTASSSTPASTTANSSSTTASWALSPRSHAPRNNLPQNARCHPERVPCAKDVCNLAAPTLSPSTHRVGISQPPLAENFHQQRSGDKSAHVRPERHASHVLPWHSQRRRGPAQKIQHKPIPQDDPRRHPQHKHKNQVSTRALGYKTK
jgi:hypothetical protein